MPRNLTHLTETGDAHMVDISDKPVSQRTASAEGFITLPAAVCDLVETAQMPKGDVLATMRIAAIMAVKRTSDLIPLCHPLSLDKITVTSERTTNPSGFRIVVEVKTSARTGVEMEALTGASVACLTLYDMTKSHSKAAEIRAIRLLKKTGGRSGDYQRTG